ARPARPGHGDVHAALSFTDGVSGRAQLDRAERCSRRYRLDGGINVARGVIGQAHDAAAVSVSGVNLKVGGVVAVADEDEARAVAGARRVEIEGRVVGDARLARASAGHRVNLVVAIAIRLKGDETGRPRRREIIER